MFDHKDVTVKVIYDQPSTGMRVGIPNCWVVATHLPTQISARAYGRSGYKAREVALIALELMVDVSGATECCFPEVIGE